MYKWQGQKLIYLAINIQEFSSGKTIYVLQEMERLSQELGMQLNGRVLMDHAQNSELDISHYNKRCERKTLNG